MRTRYRYGPPMGRRMMRRQMMGMMADEHSCCGGPHHDHERGGERQLSPAQELAFLEEYQRDLEEALADVADRVKAVRTAVAENQDQADEPSAD